MGGEVRAIEQEMCCCMPLRDLGPKRVFPGGLAVSRSIGTIKCKLKQLNAIPGAVLSTPDITFIQPENGIQWFIMASDGLWDYYPNSIQLASLIVKKITSSSGPTSAEEMSSHILNILRSNKSLRRPPDNATILVIKIISDTPCVSISRYHHQQPATIEMKRAL
jgi:serine/threonine protein phosphatase PrpC